MALTSTLDGVACELEHGARISRHGKGTATLDAVLCFEDIADAPAKDQEVVIEDGAEVLFAGLIDRVQTTGVGGSAAPPVRSAIIASDFNVLAERRFVPTVTYPAGTTVKTVLTAIVAYCPGVTLDAGQADGPTLSVDLLVDYWRPRQVMDWLESDTGWVSRIDEDKILSAVDPTTFNAPFNLADEDDDQVNDVEVSEGSAGDYANSIIVRGDGVTGSASDAGEISAHGEYEYVAQSESTDQPTVDGLAALLLATKLTLWSVKTVVYRTLTGGLTPGQTQDIVKSHRGINGTFLITEIVSVLAAFATHSVTAEESVAYSPGWRSLTRDMFGGGSPSTAGFIGGAGGGLAFIRSWMFFGGFGDGVKSATPDWVDASPIDQQIDTAVRGTLSVAMTARLRAFTAGVTVRARLWNVDLGMAATGTSAVVVTPAAVAGVTPFTTVTFTVTASAGSDRYRLQLLPGTANEPVAGIAAGV